MPDEDVLEEGGLEPAATDEASNDDALAVEDQSPEPEVYTREQLAELLPHFDRFATHEGPEAFKQYGSAYDNARKLISTGGHLTPQQEEAYRAVGIDPSEVQLPAPEPEPEEDAGPGLFGTPWQVPTTWEEVQAYASSDDPEARRLAWVAVANEASAPEHVKQAYFAHWAQSDPAGAALYQQQAAQREIDRRMQELEARIEERYGRTAADLAERNVQSLMSVAQSEIKGFKEHVNSVQALFEERVSREPAYQAWFFNEASTEQQIRELRRLTIIAAAEAEPVRQAAKQRAEAETDAAKLASRSETTRTNGAPETEQQAMKRRSLEDAKRVGGRIW